MPGSSLRNTFSTVSSPNTIDELDCSTPTGRTAVSTGSGPGTRWKRKHAVVGLVLGLRVDRPQQLAAVLGVGDGVDRDRLAVALEPVCRRCFSLGARHERERKLVELVAAARKPGLDDRHQQRRALGERDAFVEVDPGHVA